MTTNRPKPLRTDDAAGTPDFQKFIDECNSLTDPVAKAYRIIHVKGVRGATSKEIADELGVTTNVISPRITKLIKRGFIHKAASHRDNHRVHIADEFYDAQRDGDESQRKKDYCDTLRRSH